MNLYAWKASENGNTEILYTITETPVAGEDILYKEDGTPYGEIIFEDIPEYSDAKLIVPNTIIAYEANSSITLSMEAVSIESGEILFAQTIQFMRSSEDDVVIESEKFISKFKHNNVTYTIKDAQARQDITTKQNIIDSNNKLAASLVSGLATVATSGSYNDLNNKPTIPAAQVNSDWNASSGVAEILNKPTIPTVNDATITITQGGVTKGTFTVNQNSDATIALDAGGGSTNKAFTNVSASNWVADNTYADYGYKCVITGLTGVTSSMFAQVVFGPDEFDSGNYANVCETGTDSITIYSKVNTSITIPTIIVMEI